MFDLTKEIKLGRESYKKYAVARLILYLAFLASVFFVAYRILFPSVSLIFLFGNANSLKNTLVPPRVASNPDSITKSSIAARDAVTFNANPLGNFSNAKVTFTLDKTSKDINGKASAKLQKSYQAFFFPINDPAGFHDGTLLYSGGNYYVVSDAMLRKFSDSVIVSRLGYAKNSFFQVSQDDLKYNKKGEDVMDDGKYPNDTIFYIDDNYYKVKNNTLYPFISTRAFLSQFDATQAIAKNNDFLKQYPVSETALGFADGTLGSSNQSVFILSEGKSYPIENADTFNQMGLDWNSVIALDSEELGLYERQKQFTHDMPHPNGTLFFDQNLNKYFLIKNGKKHPIESEVIAKTYLKQKPILADSKESETDVSCELKKTFLGNSYTCDIPLDSLNEFIGNDYKIEASFPDNVKIKDINTTFSTPLSWRNLRSSLSRIKLSLRNNYYGQQ